MKVVVRGDRNENSNNANNNIPQWAFPAFFIFIGSLFSGIGIWLLLAEKPYLSGDSETLFVSLLCTFIGLVPIIIGVVTIFRTKKSVSNFDLMQTGVCVKLPVISITESNKSLNNIRGFYVECRNLNNEVGCKDVYKSDAIYNNNCAFLQPGDLVPIYIDWRNPDRFYMDIDGYEKVDYIDERIEQYNQY